MIHGPGRRAHRSWRLNDHFHLEVLKLLAQLAAADGDISPVEIDAIISAGRAAGVAERALEALATLLRADGGLPVPDMATLRQRPDATLRAARDLVAVDGVLDNREMEALAALEKTLADPEGAPA